MEKELYLTAEEEAYEKGYEEGYADGEKAGYNKGYEAGMEYAKYLMQRKLYRAEEFY